MRTFEEYRKSFPEFYASTMQGHLNAAFKNGAHGPDHDVTVGMLAVRIAPDERTADKAFCAALVHSVDRQFGRWDSPESKATIEQKVATSVRAHLQHLPKGFFSADEVEEIFDAVMRHGEMHPKNPNVTLTVLQDADRLANLQIAVVMRSGQHYHNVPALELEWLGSVNPKSTYPASCSVMDDLLMNLLGYLPLMQLPVAKEMAERYAARIRAYREAVKADYDELGLTGVVL